MNPFSTYLEQQILSADPVELIRIMYRHAIMAVEDARRHLEQGQIAERSARITKGYDIITELVNSLRPEASPEIAGNLSRLYVYMQERLIAANVHQADAPLAEVLSLLSTLAEAWNSLPAHAQETSSVAAFSPWTQQETPAPDGRYSFAA